MANAVLMAASPDLLKVLKKAVINFEDFLDPDGEFEYSETATRNNLMEWKAVIAQAEGRE